MSKRNFTRKAIKQTPALFSALSRRVAISQAAATSMALKPYIALDLLRSGRECGEQFDTLAQYLLFVEILCEQGLFREDDGLVKAAQKGLLKCGDQHRSTGKWELDDEAHRAISASLDLYWRQLQTASASAINQANAELSKLMSAQAAFMEQEAMAA